MLSLLLLGTAFADGLSDTQTSYIGANMLEGEVDITIGNSHVINEEDTSSHYSYFTGNTLYVGAQDDDGNTVDAIVEFFWFQSSIDRGSDFYVGIIKARSNPAQGEELYVNDWNDFGDHPVLSVEALSEDMDGAFRWEWSVPFEDYGIDAYGQIQVGHEVGFGANAQGAAMTAGSLPEGTNINGVPIQAEGEIQAKGFVSSDYKIQTQYDITLYEWEVKVNGRGDMMAWDTYLTLDARSDQSAYHEYFLIIQVDEGETFTIDNLNVLGNFDGPDWNPWAVKEVGLSLSNIELSAPFFEPPAEEEEEDWGWEPSYEPSYEPASEPAEEVVEEPAEEEETTPEGDPGFEDNQLPGLDEEEEPIVNGCSTTQNLGSTGIVLFFASFFAFFRRENH